MKKVKLTNWQEGVLFIIEVYFNDYAKIISDIKFEATQGRKGSMFSQNINAQTNASNIINSVCTSKSW